MLSIRACLAFSAASIACYCCAPPLEGQAATQPGGSIPVFQLDKTWPKALPNGWALGPISGVSVDSRDHIWMLHRSSGKKPGKGPLAPPVIEYDPDGNLVRAWGTSHPGYAWPIQEHGLSVDSDGNVWVTGNSEGDVGTILKFSPDGKPLLQIGKQDRPDEQPLNNDPSVLGKLPADLFADIPSKELFVADGERGSRRLIVFDLETGAFKRLWGAYGEKPDEGAAPVYDAGSPPSRTFSAAVHCVQIAKDGLVYVCDRGNDRIQVFQKNGKFVREAFVERQTKSPGSTASIAFSPDEKYLYVGDGVNQKVWILQRGSLEVLGSFPVAHNLHAIAVDSKGNIYAAEVAGERLEKFILVKP